MTRVEDNHATLEYLDTMMKDEETIQAVLDNPSTADSLSFASIVTVLADISKSLAVIADTLTEFNDDF